MTSMSCWSIGSRSLLRALLSRSTTTRWSTGCGWVALFSSLVRLSLPGLTKTLNWKRCARPLLLQSMYKRMKRPYWIALFVIFLSALSVGRVAAQQPTPSDDEVNAIAKQLFCPVCEHTPLEVCPTQACAQWRELIRETLSEVWSEERIKNYFVE